MGSRLYFHGMAGILTAMLIWMAGMGQVWAGEEMTADRLVYVTEIFPPHNYMENGRLKGISVDVLELMWKKIGSNRTRKDILVLPWARAIKMLETHPDMVLFGMGYTREREEKFHWVGPYFVHELCLISRADDPVSIRRLDDARHLTIGVVRLDIGHQFLVKRFFDPAGLELCDDLGQLHQKFIHNRFRLICSVPHAYFTYSESQGMPRSTFKKVLTLSSSKSGYGFSKQIPVSLVNQFRQALEELRAEGSLEKILNRYGMH